MKLISKIRAFFTVKGKQEQLELSAAEVRQEGVYLHPLNSSGHTYFVKTDEVDIIIKPGAEITEEDIRVIEKKNQQSGGIPSDDFLLEEPNPDPADVFGVEPNEDLGTPPRTPQTETSTSATSYNTFVSTPPSSLRAYMTKKKSFTVMLYPDEHERLMRLIKENGYKKVEYVLACMESAKKTSMEATYRRFTEDREQRRQKDLADAKRAREEDLRHQQANQVDR